MTKTTKETRDELKRLHEAATPGEWVHKCESSKENCACGLVIRPGDSEEGISQGIGEAIGYDCGYLHHADASLIATMRNALPDLLHDAERAAELEATEFCSGEFPCEASTAAVYLEKERDELQAKLEKWERTANVYPSVEAWNKQAERAEQLEQQNSRLREAVRAALAEVASADLAIQEQEHLAIALGDTAQRAYLDTRKSALKPLQHKLRAALDETEEKKCTCPEREPIFSKVDGAIARLSCHCFEDDPACEDHS